MKKIVSILLVALMLTISFSSMAFAHADNGETAGTQSNKWRNVEVIK